MVRHFDIDTSRPYGEFRAAYEEAVPHFDRLEAIGVAVSGAGWSAIQDLSAATAPHGFVNFFTADFTAPLSALLGTLGLPEPDSLPSGETGNADAGLPEGEMMVSTLNVSDGQVDRIETFLSEPSKIAAYFGR